VLVRVQNDARVEGIAVRSGGPHPSAFLLEGFCARLLDAEFKPFAMWTNIERWHLCRGQKSA
jgi:hypothetical protein